MDHFYSVALTRLLFHCSVLEAELCSACLRFSALEAELDPMQVVYLVTGSTGEGLRKRSRAQGVIMNEVAL